MAGRLGAGPDGTLLREAEDDGHGDGRKGHSGRRAVAAQQRENRFVRGAQGSARVTDRTQ